ncbi:uncharacterized protein LOC117127489 [Brassica rapa]|uniref:uncharacterized protein LOC117127489 n=1 Tax=Brassica campestris TaxID=3711 RepID=UPI00142DE830|nr:uncharacterized protein LOC117127489 [Brassica rapa]
MASLYMGDLDTDKCLKRLAKWMNSPRVPPPMPPGATGPASNHAASSSRSNSYPQMTLNAMLNSPARLAQPHLHPDKINGALWFAYYMGPWKSWRKVPDERRESWWQTFVDPEFNDLVYGLWKKETWTTIGERISKKKRQQKKPKYINEADWMILLEHWVTDAAKKKSKKAANSRKSDPMVASGTNERPSFTDLVRATHTRPDRTFVDYRAEELNAKGKRGHVYGLGSAQYREQAPSSRVPNGLACNLEREMRVGGLETSLQSVREDVSEVKQDVSGMKQEFASTRDAINQLLQMLRPPQAPTEQTSAQPQAPTPQP